jgi:hypothetical protein
MRSADAAKVRGVQVAAFTSLLLIAQQVAGKATRDALFLSNFRASQLPLAMASSAALSLLAAYGVSRLVVRYAPPAITVGLFATSACGFGLAWVLAFDAPRAAALLVYFQTALLGPVMISTFWSMINERFDPHAAKPAIARIAGGGTLGGVLGGLAAWRVSSFVQPNTVLMLLAALNALAVACTLATSVRRGVTQSAPLEGAASTDSATTEPAPTRVKDTPFLRQLALLVALGAAISALLDYVFSVEATAAFGKGQPLLAFFSLFWLGVALLSFLLQVTLGKVALEKLGLAVNVAVLPGIIILGGAFGLAVPGLVSSSLLRGAESIQRNTLFRAAYEQLYTPLPEDQKRSTKAIIDVGCDRLGTVVGSGLTLLVVHSTSQGQAPLLLGAIVLLGLATLPVTRQLHVGYVDALAQGMRAAAARLNLSASAQAPEAPPPDSRATLHHHRERLIERVEVLQPGGLSALVEPEQRLAAAARVVDGSAVPDALLSSAHDLLSADDAKVERALRELEPRSPAAACAILLLSHPIHHAQALLSLRSHAGSMTGQLLDALLDPTMDFTIRRRIPRALRACSTQRAADGLLLGIADERFEVRYECGRALLAVTEANPDLVISQRSVVDAIRREIEIDERIVELSAAQLDDDPELEGKRALFDGLMRDRANRSLEHMFTLLSLLLEREPLRMAFLALHHDDERYRGTALEYLDAVLPSEVREIIWPYLGETAPLPAARSARELLAELSARSSLPAGVPHD